MANGLRLRPRFGRRAAAAETATALVVTASHAQGGWCRACHSARTIVLSGRDFQAAWCGRCVESIDLATIDRTTGTFRIATRAVRRWAHDAHAHMFETLEGLVLVLLQPGPATAPHAPAPCPV